MKDYKKQFKKVLENVLEQYKVNYPTVSNDILETWALKAAHEILKDPLAREFI